MLAVADAGGDAGRALVHVKEAFADQGADAGGAGRRPRRADDAGDGGQLTATQAKPVLAEMVAAGGGDAAAIAAAKGFEAMDTSALEAMVDEAIAANAGAWAKYLAGEDKAMGALVGAVMKASRGQADGGAVTALLRSQAQLSRRSAARRAAGSSRPLDRRPRLVARSPFGSAPRPGQPKSAAGGRARRRAPTAGASASSSRSSSRRPPRNGTTCRHASSSRRTCVASATRSVSRRAASSPPDEEDPSVGDADQDLLLAVGRAGPHAREHRQQLLGGIEEVEQALLLLFEVGHPPVVRPSIPFFGESGSRAHVDSLSAAVACDRWPKIRSLMFGPDRLAPHPGDPVLSRSDMTEPAPTADDRRPIPPRPAGHRGRHRRSGGRRGAGRVGR